MSIKAKLEAVPWWVWAIVAAAVGLLCWWAAKHEAGLSGGAIPLELARRSMARAKQLRAEADDNGIRMVELNEQLEEAGEQGRAEAAARFDR